MHLKRTDLYLKRSSARSDQRRMQRLIHVRLRHRNIIFKTSRNRFVHLMYHTECRITVFDRIYDDTHCKKIIDLIERFVLVYHLFVNAEEMFDTAVDLCFDTRFFDMGTHFCDNTVHKFLAFCFTQSDLFYQVIINFRLQIFQRKVIQLYLDLGNTKSLSKRSINIHRLSRFFFLFFRLHIFQRTHIVKPVCKLDQDHTDILCHGKEHLTQILRLYFHLICRIAQLSQFCNAIHQKCDLCSELFGDLLRRHDRVLNHIVKQSCNDRLFVQLQICQNDRNAKRMNDIWFSGFSLLTLMCLISNLVSFFNHADIRGWMIFLHARNQFIIQDLRTCKILHGFYIRIGFFDLRFFHL